MNMGLQAFPYFTIVEEARLKTVAVLHIVKWRSFNIEGPTLACVGPSML